MFFNGDFMVSIKLNCSSIYANFSTKIFIDIQRYVCRNDHNSIIYNNEKYKNGNY